MSNSLNWHAEGPLIVSSDNETMGQAFRVIGGDNKDHLNNAKIMAASPDLLAALQAAAEALAAVEEDRFNVDMDAVSSALNSAALTIARATGAAA